MIQRTRPLDALIRDEDAQLSAMQESIDLDIERHRLLGHSIFVWRDGQVVEVPAEEITPLAEVRAARAKS
jgi:hypothetical protein